MSAAEQIRADLIGTVSHEFRTPLTGIRAAALTLLKRGDRLDPGAREQLLLAIIEQQERLSRLLENMLVAAQATDADDEAVAEVDAVAAEVAMLASRSPWGAGRVSLLVPPGLVAGISRMALHQVLDNLVHNALVHGQAGATSVVAAGRDEAGVWLTVSNEGRELDLTDTARLLEPFTQGGSGATREQPGIGMGLYVVRRLVEVHGGTLQVTTGDGWVSVLVRLRDVSTRTVSLIG